jgi:hypothetical protein
MSENSLSFIKAITHANIEELEVLAPLYAEKYAGNYLNLMENIGDGLGHESNHDVLTILHDYVGQEHLYNALKGAIKSNNSRSFYFLTMSSRLDITKPSTIFSDCLGEEKYKMSAWLLVNNVDINTLRHSDWDLAIPNLIDEIPSSTLESHKRWYQSLPGISAGDARDFSYTCQSLDISQIPNNLVNLIKSVGDAKLSISLLNAGYDYSKLADGYNHKGLPALEAVYLEKMVSEKINRSKVVTQAPKFNF